MIGFQKCKDLEDWLMGSGESAETSDSKAQVADQKKVPDQMGEWMFKTFDKVKAPTLKAEELDPFAAEDEEDEDDQSEDDFMLGGGMHLINKPKAQPDYVGQVAEKCADLNQFIMKMDELVQQHYVTK